MSGSTRHSLRTGIRTSRCKFFWRTSGGREADPFEFAPFYVAFDVLPHSLNAPDHIKLPMWEMLEAEQDLTSDVAPAIVAAIRHLFEQHGADRDRGNEGIRAEDDLQKICNFEASGKLGSHDADISED